MVVVDSVAALGGVPLLQDDWGIFCGMDSLTFCEFLYSSCTQSLMSFTPGVRKF